MQAVRQAKLEDTSAVSFCNTGHWAATDWFVLHEIAGNQNVKPKVRQQLQYLRDRGFIEFVSRGNYRLRS